MLKATLTLHREHLLTQTSNQKLFVALTVQPGAEASAARPQLSAAFVVDTSGSMRETVTEPAERTGRTTVVDGQRYEVVRGAKSKMDLVVEALTGVFVSDLLQTDDRLALVKFDDDAEVLLPFTEARHREDVKGAAGRLSDFSGGTLMGAGMQEALELLRLEQGSKRLLLLTDGRTSDEDLVREVGAALAEERVAVTTIGVGEEWNEELLTELTDRTQGKPFYMVPDAQDPQPPAVRLSDLPDELLVELERTAREVVTGLRLNVRTVKDVTLERVTRVYPTQNEVDRTGAQLFLGSAAAGEDTVFILEFTLPARPNARMRLAQLALTFEVPGADYRGETEPLDVVVEFTTDEARAAKLDGEVMRWVQQRNIEGLIHQATRQAPNDPAGAQKTMELARAMTVRLGNGVMTKALDRAIGELSGGKTIGVATAKTLKVGAKTQTLQSGSDDLPSGEDIRRMTGA